MKLPLMRNNILREDLDKVIELLKQNDPILTNGPKVREFEQRWSEWLGVDYSIFVSSGSAANLLSMTILKLRHPEGGEIIVPPLTWVSDIASVLQTGFTPVFVDINPTTLGMDTNGILEAINEKTRAVFLTHAQGFNALNSHLVDELERLGIPLVEDVCESHGATYKDKKLGTFGEISNFSFYYAHHLTTIEGGMICTNDKKIYQQLRMLRSHGMVREASDAELITEYKNKYPELNPDFIFAFPAYNLRSNEISATLGLSQLPRLDEMVRKRTDNLHLFFNLLNKSKYRTDFLTEGSSNYAFNVILKNGSLEKMSEIEEQLRLRDIEFRRGSAGGGNQLRQPYLENLFGPNACLNYPETEKIHFYGLYIGNFPDLTEIEIEYMCDTLNRV